MGEMNRMNTADNPYQGSTKTVLCLCSAGCLRSPTAAVVLAAEPFNFNTRAAGVDKDFAIIPVDDVLIYWADIIVCMEPRHLHQMKKDMKTRNLDILLRKQIIVLDITDDYPYRDELLMKMIREKFIEKSGWVPSEK